MLLSDKVYVLLFVFQLAASKVIVLRIGVAKYSVFAVYAAEDKPLTLIFEPAILTCPLASPVANEIPCVWSCLA